MVAAGDSFADGGFERREAKVKICLRRKNNEDQGGVGLPLVGNQATEKTSQNWSFFP